MQRTTSLQSSYNAAFARLVVFGSTQPKPIGTDGTIPLSRLDTIAARRIVRDVPKLGCEGACRVYGYSVVAWAMHAVRADVAQRQAKRARIEGAQYKSAARGLQRDGLESYGRHAEKHSRRAYRAAAKYDRTATLHAQYIR